MSSSGPPTLEPVGASPEDRHNDQRAAAPLLSGRAERVGVVQCGEEKALGRSHCSLLVPERGRRELELDFSQGHVATEQE